MYTFTYVSPIVAEITSWAILGEQFTFAMLAAATGDKQAVETRYSHKKGASASFSETPVILVIDPVRYHFAQ